MAKKRAGSRSSSRSRRSSRGRSSGGGSWKNSPILKVVLVVIILLCIVNLIVHLAGGGGSSRNSIPSDFPHTFIAAEDDGKYDSVIIKRGRMSPKPPIDENGKQYWAAYICMNERCPGREQTGGKPYVFAAVVNTPTDAPANGDMPPPEMYMETKCPLCADMYNKVRKEYKQYFDPINVQRYQTEEAKEIIKKIRERYRRNR